MLNHTHIASKTANCDDRIIPEPQSGGIDPLNKDMNDKTVGSA